MESILAVTEVGKSAATVVTALDVGLPMVCLVAFISVMSILALLSGVIRLITSVFPPEEFEPEPSIDTAIRDAVAQAFPSAKIVSIRKKK